VPTKNIRRKDKKDSKRLKNNSWRRIFRLAIVFFLLLLFLSFYNEGGWKQVWVFKQEIKKIEQQIASLQQENRVLATEIQKLKNDPYYLEKIAREKLGLVRPGEKVFVITTQEE
jgi:cell division protein FtsB